MPPKAVLETLSFLWASVGEFEDRVAVAGGVALSYWGNPRSTQDVDLALMEDTFSNLKSRWAKSGVVSRSPSKKIGPFEMTKLVFEPAETFVEVEIDILIGNGLYFENAVRRAITVAVEGLSIPVRVLSREDLIIYKFFANRLIDQADVLNLLEMHWDQLDHDYLGHWTTELKLTEELQTAFRIFGVV